jgi:uroporphyrinogen decarboxylase
VPACRRIRADRVRRIALTVATLYGRGRLQPRFSAVKAWSYRDPDSFAELIDLLVDATVGYLSGQITAGADVVQLFDTWAGVLPEAGFERWVIDPTRRITARLKDSFPTVPIIGFPRGAGLLYERYAAECGVDAVGLDTVVPIGFARERLQPRVVVQGNLDPVALLVGGSVLTEAVKEIRSALGGGPFIFNLGHGVCRKPCLKCCRARTAARRAHRFRLKPGPRWCAGRLC